MKDTSKNILPAHSPLASYIQIAYKNISEDLKRLSKEIKEKRTQSKCNKNGIVESTMFRYLHILKSLTSNKKISYYNVERPSLHNAFYKPHAKSPAKAAKGWNMFIRIIKKYFGDETGTYLASFITTHNDFSLPCLLDINERRKMLVYLYTNYPKKYNALIKRVT